MNPIVSERPAPGAGRVAALPFFGLTFALSAPFWVLGAVVGRTGALPMRLPASSLMVVAPVLAAAILTYRASGGRGVERLMRRAADARGIRGRWLVATVVTMPAIHIASYVVMRIDGRVMPEPSLVIIDVVVLAGVFLVAAAAEEIGWMGVGIGPLRDRWGPLRASLVLGVIWDIWHLPGYVQFGLGPAAIVGQSIFTVAARVLIVWLSEHTDRSVLVPILFHMTINLGVALYPGGGAAYDATITGPIAAAVAAVVVVSASRYSVRPITRDPDHRRMTYQ